MWRWWTCRRLRPRLVDAAEGTLAIDERTRVASHLARCGRCAAAVAALRDVPPLLRAEHGTLGEEFWREQRAAIMRKVSALPEPAAASPHRQPWPPIAGRRPRWVAWAPAAVAAMAMVLVLALRVTPPWQAGPAIPATDVEALDDPTLFSLSDLAGFSSPDAERTAEMLVDAGPLPELTNEELDALAQLVGVRER